MSARTIEFASEIQGTKDLALRQRSFERLRIRLALRGRIVWHFRVLIFSDFELAAIGAGNSGRAIVFVGYGARAGPDCRAGFAADCGSC